MVPTTFTGHLKLPPSLAPCNRQLLVPLDIGPYAPSIPKVSELRRKALPRTPVDEGERKGQGILMGYPGPSLCRARRSLAGRKTKKRKKVTVVQAAEYLGLTPGRVQDMVERGVLEADRFAGAIHIPGEEVERIERESAP